MENHKTEFLKLFDEHIKREGSKDLREYLCKTDFFTAPASTKYHSAFEGGLCLHSLKTYYRLKKLVEQERGENYTKQTGDETIAILGLLHDVCKIECYKSDLRNVKQNGVWVQAPYYSVDEKLPYGHGEKSVYIINGFMRLTREEAIAINWHMGGFDNRAHGFSAAISAAYEKFPVALLLHLADMQATYIDENI